MQVQGSEVQRFQDSEVQRFVCAKVWEIWGLKVFLELRGSEFERFGNL